MRIPWRLIPIAVLPILLSCGSNASNVTSAGTQTTTSSTAQPSPGSTGVPQRKGKADAATCDAIAPVGTKASNVQMSAYYAALAVAPSELKEQIQRLLDIGKQMEAEPGAKNNSSAFLAKLGQQKFEQVLRDSQAVQDWFRRNCGPETADSAWCEAFAKATFDRDLTLMNLLSLNPTNILEAMDQQSLGFYRAVLGAAPPDIAPKVQLLVDQYDKNGGKQPQDKQAVSDREAAQDAIITSVRDQCGITMKRSEF